MTAKASAHIISLLKSLDKNIHTKILVVDKVFFYRNYIAGLLTIHKYDVLTAPSGKRALDLLEKHPDIKLVVTESNLPNMDGLTLIHKIRENHKKDSLAIIGISSEENQLTAARFIKYGANDFIIKKFFTPEEFYSRVTQTIKNLERINTIKKSSLKDFLTGLYNRRYLFEFGQKLFASAIRKQITITCAMIDIDHFKKINDSYGHDVGDFALQHVSSILQKKMRATDIVTRFGGEEFCILAVNMDPKDVLKVFNSLCRDIENSPIDIGNKQTITVTVSIGVSVGLKTTLEDTIKAADKLLYKAKKSGRNKVVITGKAPGPQ